MIPSNHDCKADTSTISHLPPARSVDEGLIMKTEYKQIIKYLWMPKTILKAL